jgi:hypothetical protein
VERHLGVPRKLAFVRGRRDVEVDYRQTV